LPETRNCIAGANLADSIVASLDYFDGIRTLAANSAAGKKCDWLLIHGAAQGWQRPGSRRLAEGLGRRSSRRASDSDKLHLYRRDAKKGA
jgi:hypothetical protein